MQCATFSKSVNPRNKSISDIRIRIRLPFESSFWISVSGCKLTILPDIQPANRIVIISGALVKYLVNRAANLAVLKPDFEILDFLNDFGFFWKWLGCGKAWLWKNIVRAAYSL